MASLIEDQLHSLLMAAAGEPSGSLHSGLGRWRQRVGKLIAEALAASGGAAGREYVQVGYATTEAGPPPSGPGQPGLTSNNDVIFTGDAYGPLPYSTNVLGGFLLTGGKTYRLTASLLLGYSDPDGFATIYWVDAANNIIRPGVGDLVNVDYNNTGGAFSGTSTADLLYAPSVDTEVKLRVIEVSAGTIDILYGSNALIHEI